MKKKSDPIEVIVDTLDVMLEYRYDDSDVTEEEYALAKKRFSLALVYFVESIGDESIGNNKDV